MLTFQVFWHKLSPPLPSHPVEPICAWQPLSSCCAWPFVLLRAAHMYRLALLPMCPLLRLTANGICQAQCPYLPHFWELLCHYYAVILQKNAVILSLPCYKTSMWFKHWVMLWQPPVLQKEPENIKFGKPHTERSEGFLCSTLTNQKLINQSYKLRTRDYEYLSYYSCIVSHFNQHSLYWKFCCN